VIGRRLWDLGLLAPVQTGLRDVAAPFLQDLYGATMATVHLAVRDGTQVLYLDRLSGHASVPVVSRVGARRVCDHQRGDDARRLLDRRAGVRRGFGGRGARPRPGRPARPGRLVPALRVAARGIGRSLSAELG
jgi:hypothetical protein